MTRLILCRHADPAQPDQALVLAQVLRPLRFDAVYTSPLARAVEAATAVAHAHGLPAVEVDDMREIDFGEVDGLAFDEFPAELRSSLLEAPTRARFPGGETYDDLQRRAREAVERILAHHPDGTVCIITHAGTIRALLAAWLHVGDAGLFRIDQRHGAVNVVDWIDGVPLVRLVNGTRP